MIKITLRLLVSRFIELVTIYYEENLYTLMILFTTLSSFIEKQRDTHLQTNAHACILLPMVHLLAIIQYCFPWSTYLLLSSILDNSK